MPQPAIGSFAQRVYDQLAPLADRDEENDWALAHFLGGFGQMFQEIDDYASDGPNGEAGWSSLVDVNRAPVKGLGWLGQFVGVTLLPNVDEATQRAWVRTRQGWQRGTPAAMKSAAQQYLGGNKTVYFLERDTDPYHLTVYTLANETPADPVAGNPAMTLSGNEITDAVRAAGVQGDGIFNDSSYGLWEGTTNMIKNGSVATNLNGLVGNGTGSTITRDGTQAKFGGWSAKVVCSGSQGGQGLFIAEAPPTPVSASTTYTYSAWVFSPTGGVTLRLAVDEKTSVPGFIRQDQSPDFAIVPGWQRLKFTFTTAPNAATVNFYVITIAATATTYWVDGMQCEAKPYATPFVHTDGATAARGTAHVGAPAALIAPTQGWIAARVRMGTTPAEQAVAATEQPGIFGWGSWFNGYRVLYSTGLWQFQRARGPTSSPWNGIGVNVGDSWNAGDYVTVIAAWTADRIKLSIDGAPFSEALGAMIPALVDLPSTFSIGEQAVGGQMLDGDMLWLAAGKGTLSDADVADMHAAAVLGGKIWGDMPANSAPTILWSADTAAYQMAGTSNAKVLAALLSQKPGGIVMTYGITTGQDYAAIYATRASYAAIFSAYATYQALQLG